MKHSGKKIQVQQGQRKRRKIFEKRKESLDMDTVNIFISNNRKKLTSWQAAKVYLDMGKGEQA